MDAQDEDVSEDVSVTSFEWSDEENEYNFKEVKVNGHDVVGNKTVPAESSCSLVPAGAAASCAEQLVRVVGGLYKSPHHSDLVLHCRGGKLPGHRLLLAGLAASPLGPILTSDTDIADIFLLDFDVSSVGTALQLLYTGSIVVSSRDIVSVKQILGLLGLGSFDVIELKEVKKKKERQKLKVKHEKNLGSRRVPQEQKIVSARKKRVFMASLDPSELTCDICHKSFPALYKLKIHKLIHSDSFPFMCTKCGKGFNNKYKLQSHEKKKLCESESSKAEKVSKPPKTVNLTTYDCNECPMTFNLVKELKKHIQLVHRVKEQLTCIHCSVVCRSQKTLITHLKVVHNDHDSGLKCTCGVCGKKFQKLSNLEDHILRHSEIKQFGCMYCPKRCATKQDLDRHLRSHSGEATFMCQFCSRTFVHRKTYANHVRKHLGQKPYHCKPCNKSFAALTYLKKHQLSHQRKGDATKIVTSKKGVRGSSGSLSYIDHFTAPEDALEAALLDSQVLESDMSRVYIPSAHYIQTGDVGDSVTPGGLGQLQVITDYTEVSRLTYDNKAAELGTSLPHYCKDAAMQDGAALGGMYGSSKTSSVVNMDSNVTIMYSNEDENSQDDGYLMGLFEPQPSTTETTLEKL